MPRKKKEEAKEKPKKAKIKVKTKEPKEVKQDRKKEQEAAVQPTMNIGMIGHVDHGKTTLTECLSGKWTDTHSEELKKGITIRLGYANCSFFRDEKEEGDKVYTTSPVSSDGKTKNKLISKISIVDAPGHESLMATMLSGATIMDGALLLVAANETCPQPQTNEHLKALEIIGVKNVIVVQNKIDLVSEEDAVKNYEQIRQFLSNTVYKDVPIIPISAKYKINIDFLIKTIIEKIPQPERDLTKPPLLFIARSFDINKPGTVISKLRGGVLGGAVQQGRFKVGDEIEIRPGYEVEERNQKVFKPLRTTITAIMSGADPIKEATPGGSVALMTKLDPNIVKSDKMSGNLIGKPGQLPETLYTIELETHLLERVVGIKDELLVEPIRTNEVLMLNVNSTATVGVVTGMSKNSIKCKLKIPICAYKETRVTISRVVKSRFRLIGYGILK